MPQPLSTGMVIALIVVLVIAWCMFFIAVIRFAGRVGGWFQLAQFYALDDEDIEGERFRFKSVGMRRAVNYGGIAEFIVTPRGLCIKIAKPFRFGHPPLLLPWDQMNVRQGSALLMNTIFIEMEKAPQLPLRIRFSTAMKIKQAAGEYWPSDIV